jgi:hypothetical protein
MAGLNRDRRSRVFHESRESKRGLRRCPACSMVCGMAARGFVCGLSRCPRTFVYLHPPLGLGVAASVRVEPGTT